MDFDVTDQLMITYLEFVRYCRRNESSIKSTTQSGQKYWTIFSMNLVHL